MAELEFETRAAYVQNVPAEIRIWPNGMPKLGDNGSWGPHNTPLVFSLEGAIKFRAQLDAAIKKASGK